MTKSPSHPDSFVRRHIGPSPDDIESMLEELGYGDLSELSKSIVPASILSDKILEIPPSLSEFGVNSRLKSLASKNKLFKNFVGH